MACCHSGREQGVVPSADCPSGHRPLLVEELDAGSLEHELPPVPSHAFQLADDLVRAQVRVLRLDFDERPRAADGVGRHDYGLVHLEQVRDQVVGSAHKHALRYEALGFVQSDRGRVWA